MQPVTAEGDHSLSHPRPERRATMVLIVGEALQTALRPLLEDDGYRVHTAGSLAGGLVAHAAEPAAVLIVDEELPDGSGLDLVQQVAYEDWATRIIAVSGHTGEYATRFDATARAFGAAYTFAKPLPLAQVRATVRNLAPLRR